jgi:Domain of unknown function (DUF4844)
MIWRAFIYVVAVLLLLGGSAGTYVFWPREQALSVTSETLVKLLALRESDTFADLPGVEPSVERARMKATLNELLSQLIQGIEANPRKSWVVAQMKPTVQKIYLEDTEARERFVGYLHDVLVILEIESTNGAFFQYLIFI